MPGAARERPHPDDPTRDTLVDVEDDELGAPATNGHESVAHGAADAAEALAGPPAEAGPTDGQDGGWQGPAADDGDGVEADAGDAADAAMGEVPGGDARAAVPDPETFVDAIAEQVAAEFATPARRADPVGDAHVVRNPGLAPGARRWPAGVVDVDGFDVLAASYRLQGHVHRTPVLTSQALDDRAGCRLFLKAEHLQRVGAFKIRGATNAVLQLDDEAAARGVVAHSSGNHAQALALAARTRGIGAHLVMPEGTSRVKVDAVRGYGADVSWCDPTLAAREAAVAALVERTGATEVHPFDDPRIIAGAGTAALELLQDVPRLDTVVVPVGGGGLLSGTALAVAGLAPETEVWAAEPVLADDAARSLATGTRQPERPPRTIAEGVRTSLSDRTFAIIQAGVTGIATVTDDEIVDAMRFLWTRTKQLVEPSGALALAAVLAGRIPGRRIGLVLTGGNVDLDALPW